jgi:dihydroorotate dehydrogenase (fumarate)
MTSLKTKYLGFDLKSPVIVGSCGLNNSIDNLKSMEEAGAGAIVLKSLFEEQIIEERVKSATQGIYTSFHPEAMEYIAQMSMNFGPEDYLRLIRNAKDALTIPVIASVNCISKEYWVEFAKKIEKAGADAIELNISHIVHDVNTSANDITDDYLATFRAVKESVSIPVAVKMGSNYTNIVRMVKLIQNYGAQGVVLFNRFYQVDIDINTLELVPGYIRSSRKDITEAIRWVSIVSSKTDIDIAGSRGVKDGEDVIKLLLAGADAVQVVSALYKNGIGYISNINSEIEKWMESKGFETIDQFKGKLSQKNMEDPKAWERQQYIKALVGVE